MNRIERNLQKQIKAFLEKEGAVVLKTSPGVLNPTGIPDLLALYKTKWAMIEVKSSATAKTQPLQPIQIARFRDMNPGGVFIVFPENWERVQYVLRQTLLAA